MHGFTASQPFTRLAASGGRGTLRARKHAPQLLAACCCLAALLALQLAPSAAAVDITLLHYNDWHHRVEPNNDYIHAICKPWEDEQGHCSGGLPRMKAFIDSERSADPDLVLLNAGDDFVGTTWDRKFGLDSPAGFMNSLAPDVMTIGNHEFDYSLDELATYLEQLHHPALACNVDAGGHRLGGKLRQYITKTVKGVKLCIFGLTTMDTNAKPIKPAKILDPYQKGRECVAQMKDDGCSNIILLSHLGYTSDIFAARLIPGIDLIVGGHSHTFLWSNSSGPVPAYDFPNGLPSKSSSSSSSSSSSPAGNRTAGSSGSSGKGGSGDGKSWSQQHHSKNKAKAGGGGQQVDKFDRVPSSAASTAGHGNHSSDAFRSKTAASPARNSSNSTRTKSIAPKTSSGNSTSSKGAASSKAFKPFSTTTSSANGGNSSTVSSTNATRPPPPANVTRSYSPPASSRSSSNSTKSSGSKPPAPAAASNVSSGSNSSGSVAPKGKQQQQTSSLTKSQGPAKGNDDVGADQDWVNIPGSFNRQGGKVDYVEGQYPTWVESPSEKGRKVPIVQAAWGSRYIGKLTLTFDGQGRLVGLSGAPVLLGGALSSHPLPEDQGVKEQIRRKKWWQ